MSDKDKKDGKDDQLLELPMMKLDLDELISSIMQKISPKDIEIANRRQFLEASFMVGRAERRAKEVNKIFKQSIERMEKYIGEVKAEENEVEAQIKKKEEILAASYEEVIEDDSDDDVTFIGSSFDSTKRQQVSVSSQQAASRPHASSPTLTAMRAALANTLNRQTGLPPVQTQMKPGNVVRVVPDGQGIGKDFITPVWTEIGHGSKVLAKKNNDIWYAGMVTDISKPENTKDLGEWVYKVKFDGKGTKLVTGHNIAYREPITPTTFLKVGTRVAALYRDDESGSASSIFAGIVAEAPSVKNQRRFLVFFDDGYAQYCWSKELHKVYYQSENVWEDIHPDSQEFIKEYLKQYPERPMVRLMEGQIVKTEWNGRWWTAKVMEVDSSLVKMYFQADKRTEWIYRGSTRLEPLFKALANAEAIKAAGTSKGRRLNMDPKGKKTPTVEYTRGASVEEDKKGSASTMKPPTKPAPAATAVQEKKRSVARKSTGHSEFRPSKGPRSLMAEDDFPGSFEGWEAPWLKMNRRQISQPRKPQNQGSKGFEASSISSNKQGRDMASVLQERLASPADITECVDDREAMGERLDTLIDTKNKERKTFVPHSCCGRCVKESEEELDKHVGKNPLLFPLLCSWERQIGKMRPGGRKCVLYRAPCGRRLRTIEELDTFLSITDSQLFIDHFCFDPWLHVHTEFVPVKTFCDIKDLSYGKEKVPISCVNAIDRQYPDYVEYSSFRIPAKGVTIPLDDEFLQCCDCTDNCMDRSKCACQQLTIENTTWVGDMQTTAGYHHRRLKEPIFTGVVECNSRCKCDRRCRNRVAQNGLSCRLQVFKTEKRGWGLRCLNDIPQGGFICIYAGQLLTDTGANDDGKQYGDEYLAELDFIEVVERQKEGYESEVEDPDGDIVNDHAEEDSDDDFCNGNGGDDGPASSDSDFETSGGRGVEGKVHETRTRRRMQSPSADQSSKKKQEPLTTLVLKRNTMGSEAWTTEEKKRGRKEDGDDEGDSDNSQHHSRKEELMDVDEVPNKDLPSTKSEEQKAQDPVKKESSKKELTVEKTDSEWLSQVGSLKLSGTNSSKLFQPDSNSSKMLHRARKSTGGSRFKNLPNPKMANVIQETEEEEQKPKQGTRSFFTDSSSCYIMDAKSMGNIGRYLNHSCTPNVFVQNIFVDTHDLRFPWVAFFAGQYIRAGTELTWDYNYEVGSVPDKVLYCYCGSPMCRGRLL